MTIENENSLKTLVGMLIGVLHGEYSDTRELAVIQLSILGEKAVPFISAFLKDELEKENDMIKYFEMYKKFELKQDDVRKKSVKFDSINVNVWNADKAKEKMRYEESFEKSKFERDQALKTLEDFSEILKKKYNISDPYFFGIGYDFNSIKILDKIENASGGVSRRRAIEGVLRALSIIGEKEVIPLLQKLPIYQFPYNDLLDQLYPENWRLLTPVFENAKVVIKKIQNQ